MGGLCEEVLETGSVTGTGTNQSSIFTDWAPSLVIIEGSKHPVSTESMLERLLQMIFSTGRSVKVCCGMVAIIFRSIFHFLNYTQNG